MTGCKEVIITQNDDSTYKLEFVGFKLMNKGEEVEANIVFPKVTKDIVDFAKQKPTTYDFAKFNAFTTDKESTIFTICIPE